MSARADYGRFYGQNCAAWCWTRGFMGLPVRRCSKLAAGFDPIQGEWLCSYHQTKGNACLSRIEAVGRRRRSDNDTKRRRRRRKRFSVGADQ